MALNPSTNGTMSGRVTAADASYPYGSSKDETSPGAGDGTPYFKARADDIFGFQQSLLDEAGIVPSGNADNVPTSQYKEAVRTILNVRTVTHNMSSDANYTLTVAQNTKRRVIITDTGVVLTAAIDIVVDTLQKAFIAQNDTLQDLTYKTSAGLGIVVLAGTTRELYNDGTDVIDIFSNAVESLPDFSNSKNTSGYQKLPNGLILQWDNDAIGTSAGTLNNFPITFPNAFLSGVVSDGNAVADIIASIDFPGSSSSQINLRSSIAGDSVVSYFAIGY